MKKWTFLLLAALAAVTFMVACQDPGYLTAADLNGYVKGPDCMSCHTSTGATTNAFRTAQVTFEESGHALGIRTGDGLVAESAVEFAMAEGTGAGCGKCHGSEGFVAWVANGPAALTTAPVVVDAVDNTATNLATATDAYYPAANVNKNTVATTVPTIVSCFTCHDPHVKGTMALRTETQVPMVWGMTTSGTTSTINFNGGAGNLCANCHQDRDSVARLDYTFGKQVFTAAKPTATPPTAASWTTANTNVTYAASPHYSIQADFLMGVNSAAKSAVVTKGYDPLTAGDTMAAGPHYGPYGTCVECHVQDGEHNMYLTAIDSTGKKTDKVAVCLTCHTAGTVYVTTYGAPAFDGTKTTFAAAMTHKTTTGTDAAYYPSLFANIETAKANLLNYFGAAGNFYTSATGTTAGVNGTNMPAVVSLANYNASPVVKADYTYTAGKQWNVDYRFAWGRTYKGYCTVKQAQALWNLMVFTYDKSNGLHNPQYAAQLLYDAIELIKADTGSLNQTITNPWTTRP